MRRFTFSRTLCFAFAAFMAFCCGSTHAARASDHADTPLLVSTGRHDARITDRFAFTRPTS